MSRLHHLGLVASGVLFACLTGCAPSISNDTSLTKRLANRGPVALSADNPFIAANLLLTREMERSPELKGFVEHRGQPAALTVERDLFGSLGLTLFYPDKGERYVLELIDGMWIISSPLPNSPHAPMSPLVATASQGSGAAPTTISGTEPNHGERLAADGEGTSTPLTPHVILVERRQSAAALTPSGSALITPLPESAARESSDTARAALQPQGWTSHATAPSVAPADTEAHLTPPPPPPPLERLRAEATGHPAETTPRGDLVHHVTDSGETLELIAEWYTDGVGNAPRLARINGRMVTAALKPGDTIVVPAYLIVNRNRLTDGARRELTGS